jgi:hypothetical protein
MKQKNHKCLFTLTFFLKEVLEITSVSQAHNTVLHEKITQKALKDSGHIL